MSSELDERRLALEERRADADIELHRRELELQGRAQELKEREAERALRISFTPAATALIAGVVSIITAAVTSVLGGMWALQTQREKSQTELALLESKNRSDIEIQDKTAQANLRLKEQERQFDIVVKATENRTPQDAANNLLFFVDIGYLPDSEKKIREKARQGNVPVITSSDATAREPSWKQYQGRLGNTESGDAKKYRGRGYLMTTGRALYANSSKVAGVDLVAVPEKLTDPQIAAKVLVNWFVARNDRFIEALNADDYARA